MAIDFDAWKNPTTDNIKKYADAFDLNYRKTDEEIVNAFKKKSSEDVFRERVHLINTSYHTRVPVENMVDNILNIKNLGDLINNGDAKAVDFITNCGDKHYFVFATKYCCFGNMKKFPIYDSLSAKVLQWFNDRDGFAKSIQFEKIKDIRNYITYKDAIDMFIKKYKLKLSNYKELDKFLWLVGKNM